MKIRANDVQWMCGSWSPAAACRGLLKRTVLIALVMFGAFSGRASCWYVGNTAAGEWVQYTNVWFSAGHYRFTANAGSASNSAAMHLEVDGSTLRSSVAVPNTGRADTFQFIHLGSVTLAEGYHTIRAVFETSNISLDWVMMRKDTDTTTSVKATDTVMTRPSTAGTLFAPIVGFNHHSNHDSIFTSDDPAGLTGQPENADDGIPYSNSQMTNWYAVPMYRDFDRRTDRYWDVMVEQLLASRAQVPLLHCREDSLDTIHDLQDRDYGPGAGWFEGRQLKKFTDAVLRNPQAATSLQVGMFFENGGTADRYHALYDSYPAWSDASFADYVMDYWLGPWFDNVPTRLLYQPVPARPVICVYSSRPEGVISDGQMGVFLANIRSRMLARYGLNPLFILPIGGDVDAAALAEAWGQAPWGSWGGPMYTANLFAGTRWAFSSCGSRMRIDETWMSDWDPVTNTGTPADNSDGIDHFQGRLDANGNSVLTGFYNQAVTEGTRLVQEEGFYNIAEGNAIFRSQSRGWTFPNQHLEAMRQYADPTTESFVFEAETCDSYHKNSTHQNRGGSYRREWFSSVSGLDVYRPLHNVQPAVQKSTGPGTLTKISAGFFDVWALDSTGKVWAQHISGQSNTWASVSISPAAKFTDLSVGKHYAWAINGTSVYCCKLPYGWTYNAHTTWTLQSGSMTRLSVNDDDVWAIDASGAIYRRPVHAVTVTNNDWTAVSGPSLSQISSDGAFVWGMSGSNIYFTTTAEISWTQVPNPYNLTQVEVGSEEVWGINAAGNIYRISASGTGTWELMEGSATQISVGENYVLTLSGNTPYSRKLEGYKNGTVASAPPAVTAVTTAGNGQIRLDWNEVLGATCYDIKRATVSGGPYTTVATGVYQTPSYADTGLTNGTTYYYVVASVNGGGGTDSAQVSVTPNTAGTVSLAPTNLVAVAGVHQVTLSWSASPGATSYNVKRGGITGGPYAVVATGVTANSYTNTGLADAACFYVVSAVNAAGESFTDSGEASATPYSLPLSRTGWTVSASTNSGNAYKATDGNISTRWDTSGKQVFGQWFQADMKTARTFYKLILDHGASVNDYPRGYEVYVSNDGSSWGSPVATGVGTVNSTTIEFEPQTARYIRIVQTGSTGGTYWSIHEFYVYEVELFAPDAPTGLVAEGAADAQVQLAWAGSDGAVSYNVKRASSVGGPYTVIATASDVNYTVTNALVGRTFYYVVSAVNAAGESSHSSPVSAVALPGNVTSQVDAASGAFTVGIWSPSGQVCILDSSTSLVQGVWIPVATNVATGDGELQMTDPSATGPSCFYRVRYE